MVSFRTTIHTRSIETPATEKLAVMQGVDMMLAAIAGRLRRDVDQRSICR